MPRQFRHRDRSKHTSRGSYGSFTGSVHVYQEGINDYVGSPRGDGYLFLERWEHTPVRINGLVGSTVVTNFVPDNHIPGGLADWPGGVPDLTAAVTKVLANTNPNRRTVDMPVFLFELADLPKMLKSVGEDLFRLAAKRNKPPSIRDTITYSAGKNLEVQFGWLPLISDLGKMLDFENIVDKRVKELQRLASDKGLRRRFTVWENELQYDGSSALQSSNFSASASFKIINRGKCWATLRWRPDQSATGDLPLNDRNIPELARRATLDLSLGLRQGIDAASAWEAIPFSWLVDYFANVGDVLKANRNEIPVTPSNMCVMYSQDSICRFTNVQCSHQLKGSDGTTKYTTKTRYVYLSPSPGLSANVGFLNPNQWSILGSLAALKLLGGKPGVQL